MTMTADNKQQFKQKWLAMTANWGGMATPNPLAQVREFLGPNIGDYHASLIANWIQNCGDASKAGEQCKKELGEGPGWNLLTWQAEVNKALLTNVKPNSQLVYDNLVAWGKCRFFDPENPGKSKDKSLADDAKEFGADPAIKAGKAAAQAAGDILQPVGLGIVGLLALGVIVFAATR